MSLTYSASLSWDLHICKDVIFFLKRVATSPLGLSFLSFLYTSYPCMWNLKKLLRCFSWKQHTSMFFFCRIVQIPICLVSLLLHFSELYKAGGQSSYCAVPPSHGKTARVAVSSIGWTPLRCRPILATNQRGDTTLS